MKGKGKGGEGGVGGEVVVFPRQDVIAHFISVIANLRLLSGIYDEALYTFK